MSESGECGREECEGEEGESVSGDLYPGVCRYYTDDGLVQPGGGGRGRGGGEGGIKCLQMGTGVVY